MQKSVPARIAVVARDEAVRDSLALLLNAAGCIALPFRSGAAFLAAPTAWRADCLVLDGEIDDMTAWEMLDRLRELGSTMKVALFTAKLSPDLLQRAAQAGISQVLEAPLIAAGLMEFVGRSRTNGTRGA